jgi:hypothetical protein
LPKGVATFTVLTRVSPSISYNPLPPITPMLTGSVFALRFAMLA